MEKPGQAVQEVQAQGQAVEGQAQGQAQESKDLGITGGEVDEAKARLSGMDSAEAQILDRLNMEDKAKTKPDEGKAPEPPKDKKDKLKDVAKKGAEATAEEKEEIADYILDRFKDKKDPNREVAKSYFYAEKVITKQGQKLAEAKQKIEALTHLIEDLKQRGQDTGKASAELEGSLEDYAELTSETPTGEQAPFDTRTETEKLIESTLDKKLAPIYRAQVIQDNLKRDAQVVETLREKYEDFGELEPRIASIISSKKVDIFNPNKLEIAYLMAKGLKAHEDAITKSQGKAPNKPDTTRRVDKESEKAKAYTETAGNPEPGNTDDYSKKLEKARKSGDSDAWADVIASRLNL